jgi:enterochelin esterase-like enzyme
MPDSMTSPRLQRLADELASSTDPGTTLNAFWQEMATAGTPLIEPTGDPDKVLVTFLYHAITPLTSVTIREQVSWKSPHERLFIRLGETDCWYLTWLMRPELRFSYSFVVTSAGGDEQVVADPLSHRLELEDWDEGKAPVAVLPRAEPLPWLAPDPSVLAGTRHAHTFRSEILGNERPVWVSTPAGYRNDGKPYPFVVIFDGVPHHSAQHIRDRLVAAGEIPPLVLILVDQIGRRGVELPGNPEFSRAIATELVPWARERYNLTTDPAGVALNGRSFGGLCSAYTALKYPGVFGNVFMQSGSCWEHPTVMNRYRETPGQTIPIGTPAEIPIIIDAYMTSPRQPVRIYQECGAVENGPPPARIWQIFGNRWLHDILVLKGYDTAYREFAGGHDDAWWRGTWAEGITWLFGSPASSAN